MNPLELPGSNRLPASKPGRQINPLIAAAISGSGEFTATNASSGDPSSSEGFKPSAMGSDVSSDVLKPDEQIKVQTAPLIHRGDTTPRGNPIPAPSEFAKERPPRDRKEKTTGLIPNDFTPTGGNALQPDFVSPSPGGPAPVWRRCFAGIADGITLVVLMAAVGLPLSAGGYGWALSQAGAVIENGLPQLTSNPGNAAATWDLITSLFHHGGIARGMDIAVRLMRADDQQPFLTLFVANALGVLFLLVTIITHLIGATVVRGAPFWHRRLAIEIVEHRTGYHLTWGRSVARWVVCGILWPLAPIALGWDKRSLHDVFTGCAVRAKRR
jgi:hypothetical protein